MPNRGTKYCRISLLLIAFYTCKLLRKLQIHNRQMFCALQISFFFFRNLYVLFSTIFHLNLRIYCIIYTRNKTKVSHRMLRAEYTTSISTFKKKKTATKKTVLPKKKKLTGIIYKKRNLTKIVQFALNRTVSLHKFNFNGCSLIDS